MKFNDKDELAKPIKREPEMFNTVKNTGWCLLLASLLVAPALSAAVLEEVVVTAQKRSQSVQDVGISITALSGDQIEQLGMTNAQQITAMAPGASTVQPNGEANYSIAIRGVANSDFTANVESPVAVYIDEVYVSQASGTGFALFDLERAEILRGPQGTLFGRNATGGLVHFITRKPSQEADGYAKVTLGDYDQVRFEGAMGGGLLDTLSARLSVATHHNDGYITNRLEPGRKLNNANDRSARLQFLFEPNDSVDLLLNLRGANQNIRTGFFENVSSIGMDGQLTPNTPNTVLDGYLDDDGDVFAGDYDDPGFNDLETYGVSATLNWYFDQMTLTSVTDFSSVERTYIEDSDASPVALFNFFLTTDAEQFSQEIRLDGETDTLKWVAGLYYLNLQTDDSNGGITDPFIGPAETPGAEAGLLNPYSNDLESLSVFGQTEFDLSDNVVATLGLRIIRDKRSFDYVLEAVEFLNPASVPGFNSAANLSTLGELATYASKRDDTEAAARAQIDWIPTEDLRVYLGWNRGVKGGNYNAPLFPFADPDLDFDDATLAYDPEQLDAYEAGFKYTFADGLARLNGAVYYYDYGDYQAFNFVGLDALTTNADADSNGFELELQALPAEGLDVLLGVAYNDITVDLPGGVKARSVQSPEWNVNGLVRYEWPAFNGMISVQGDFVYRSEHVFALSGLPNVTEGGYTVANASASYASQDESWLLTLFVDNVSDEEYLVQTFNLSTVDLFGITEQYYGRPRWWGGSLRYSF